MANPSAWTTANVSTEAELFRHFPEGFILRSLFSSAHMGAAIRMQPGSRILDIGCFRANNLVPFYDRRLECHGIDINDDMVGIARKHADLHRMSGRFSVGSNRDIPYPDSHFDIVLSIATIHYEESVADLTAALHEMRRVMKPGGCLLISTIGPRHHMLADASPLSCNRYRAGQAAGVRAGGIFTVFDDPQTFRMVCSEVFPTTALATIMERYARSAFDLYVVRCQADGA